MEAYRPLGPGGESIHLLVAGSASMGFPGTSLTGGDRAAVILAYEVGGDPKQGWPDPHNTIVVNGNGIDRFNALAVRPPPSCTGEADCPTDLISNFDFCGGGITGSTNAPIEGGFNDDDPPNSNRTSGGRDGMTFCWVLDGNTVKLVFGGYVGPLDGGCTERDGDVLILPDDLLVVSFPASCDSGNQHENSVIKVDEEGLVIVNNESEFSSVIPAESTRAPVLIPGPEPDSFFWVAEESSDPLKAIREFFLGQIRERRKAQLEIRGDLAGAAIVAITDTSVFDGPMVIGTNVSEADDGAFNPQLSVGPERGRRLAVSLGETNSGATSVLLIHVDLQTLEVLSEGWLGGSGDDRASSVRSDGDCVLVAGSTTSMDCPVTAGAPQPVIGGGTDGFLAKICCEDDPQGELIYATYMGGPSREVAEDIVALPNGAEVAVGTGGAIPASTAPHAGGLSDIFLAKLFKPRLIRRAIVGPADFLQ